MWHASLIQTIKIKCCIIGPPKIKKRKKNYNKSNRCYAIKLDQMLARGHTFHGIIYLCIILIFFFRLLLSICFRRNNLIHLRHFTVPQKRNKKKRNQMRTIFAWIQNIVCYSLLYEGFFFFLMKCCAFFNLMRQVNVIEKSNDEFTDALSRFHSITPTTTTTKML